MLRSDKLIKWGVFGLLIFSPWWNGAKEIFPFGIIQIVTCLLFILWIRKNGASEKITFRKTNLDFPLFLFLIILVVSTLFSVYFHNSLVYLNAIITYMLIYFLLINVVLLKPGKFLKISYNSIIVIGCILSCIGIDQYSNGLVVKASFPDANFLAGYLVLAIAIVLNNLLLRQIKYSKHSTAYVDFDMNKKQEVENLNPLLFIFYLISICLMLICLVFTHSRGGLLSIFVTILFIFFIRFRIWGCITVFVVWLILFIVLPPSYLMNTFKMGGNDPYIYQRYNIWKSSLAIMAENPFLGVGMGNFEIGFYKHNFPVKNVLARYSKYTRFAHNEMLQIGAEAGVVALLIFLWLIYLYFEKGVGLLNNKFAIENDDYLIYKKYGSAALCASVAIFSHSLVDFNLHLPAIMLPLILFVATVMGVNINYSEFPYNKRRLVFILKGFIFMVIFFAVMIVSGNFFEKKKDWRKAIFCNPLNATYYKELGDLYLTHSNEAEKPMGENKILWAYKKMVLLSPYDAYYRYKLATFFYDTNPKEFLFDALGEYKKAIAYNPTEPFSLFYLAALYFNEGSYEKARYLLQDAVDIEPNFIEAHYRLGIVFLYLNRNRNAYEQFLKVLDLKEKIKSMHSFNSTYEKALLKFDYSLLYNTMGDFHLKQGDLEKAIDFYNTAIKINPNFTEVYSNLAWIYFHNKDYKKAESMIKEALKLDPDNEVFKRNLNEVNKAIKK